ncbi:hypothetical protein RMSM_04523 [Rhodopirellula maiorica SM1]|uniref:Uncharacterized protein n=1 Tax=Rhodopirellula maiorica SM1 TaxID=1265738 RepID=M5RHB1_9BACT|nr:hypothetical protein RMSM_04523 [Rhodopirellula maiorica SM1]
MRVVRVTLSRTFSDASRFNESTSPLTVFRYEQPLVLRLHKNS